MKEKSLLMILMLLSSSFLFSQIEATDETIYIFWLKQLDNGNYKNVNCNEYIWYCQNYDNTNYSNAAKNEFDRVEYAKKTIAKLRDKIAAANYNQIYTRRSWSWLKEYDFNEESFSLNSSPNVKGAILSSKYGRYDIVTEAINKTSLPSLKIKMSPPDAKNLSKMIEKPANFGKMERKVYTTTKFNFCNISIEKGEGTPTQPSTVEYLRVFIRQIDVYSDQYFSNKIATFYPEKTSMNTVTGALVDNGLIVEYYDGTWKHLQTDKSQSIDIIKTKANQMNWNYRILEFKNGVLSSPIKWYYSNGKTSGIEDITNNCFEPKCRNGFFSKYYQRGVKQWEQIWEMGKQAKYSLEWFESGNLHIVKSYFGSGSGAVIEYNEKGKRIKQDYYYNGMLSNSESGSSFRNDRLITQWGFVFPDNGRVIFKPGLKDFINNSNQDKTAINENTKLTGLMDERTGKLILFDKFDDNLNNWPVVSKDNYSFYIKDGKYIGGSLTGSRSCSKIQPNFNINNDYLVSVSAKHTYGKYFQAGLIFSFKDWQNYYVLLIGGNRFYQITQVKDGIDIELKAPKMSDYLKSEGNTFAIKKTNKIFEVYLNDNFETKIELPILGNSVGLCISQESVTEFDDFKIIEFE